MSEPRPADPAEGRRRRIPRIDLRWLVAGLLVALVVATGALVVFQTTTSNRVRAASEGPAATTLTEPVEKRRLTARVVTRGTVVTTDEVGLDCMPSVAGAADVRVFTRKPAVGARVTGGGLIAAVNGRPVVALAGAVPAFRDMLPGSSGSDVRQLQVALTRLGHRITDRSGVFGPSTQSAVAKVYSRAGFAPVGPSDEDRARLRDAQEAARAADDGVRQARSALASAARGASKADILRARIALDDALKALAAGPASGPRRELLALEAAEARARLDALRRRPDTRAQRSALAAAQQRSSAARAERGRVSATVGIRVPYCEIVFIPALPASIVAAAGAASGASGGGSSEPSQPAAAAAGDSAGQDESWVTLAPGSLSIEATLPGADARGLRIGGAMDYASDDTASAGSGRISAITPKGAETVVRITPSAPMPATERGANLRVTAATTSTNGDVLVVPTAAVKGTTDGKARVTTLDSDGERHDVPVQAGLSAEGFVEVASTDPGLPLDAGDRVVVSG